jgi:hypothetical protein
MALYGDFFIRADDFACSAFAGQQWQQRLNSMTTIRCDARCLYLNGICTAISGGGSKRKATPHSK